MIVILIILYNINDIFNQSIQMSDDGNHIFIDGVVYTYIPTTIQSLITILDRDYLIGDNGEDELVYITTCATKNEHSVLDAIRVAALDYRIYNIVNTDYIQFGATTTTKSTSTSTATEDE